MKKNMALLDRVLRMLIAVGLIIFYFKATLTTPWDYLIPTVAGIFLLTAFFGTCPLYTLFGIDTRQFKESDRPVQ